MHIGKVSLRNIRGFESLDFDLKRPGGTCAGWTVFTGDNGSGKSALVKAIALALAGRDTGRSLQPDFRGWIRQGAEPYEASIHLEIVQRPGDDEIVLGGRKPGPSFPAELRLRNGGRDVSLEAPVPDGRPPNYQSPERTIWSADAVGWFSCGYGPFRRVFGHSTDAARLMTMSTTARFATMFEEAASLGEVDQWLRGLKHKALENKADEKEQLAVLVDILGDELMPNEIVIDRVDSDGLWLRDRNGVRLSWRDMSDGYRSALAFLADILRHMIAVYGTKGLTSRDENGRLRIARSGVVLIDEIDAHLHPEWQREIGFWLKDHFPNVQFLVTTHSPLICQAADANGLFVLPEPGSGVAPRALDEDERRRIVASRPDTILLSPAFGLDNTRSPKAVKARAEYGSLQAKRRAGAELTSAEKEQLGQLEMFANTDEGP